MKRVLALMLVFSMLLSLPLFLISAKSTSAQEFENSVDDFKKLNHENVISYMMYSNNPTDPNPECGEKPMPDSLAHETVWSIGNRKYDRDDCCFIMGGSSTGSFATQTPGYVEWISYGYARFRCEVGAGMWGHSGGSRYLFEVVAVLASGEKQSIEKTPAFMEMAQDPYLFDVALPEGTVAVRVQLYTENGNWSATSCVIANAYLYGEQSASALGEGGVYTVANITRYATASLRLYHANVHSYALYFSAADPEDSSAEKPLPDSLAGDTTWHIGPNSYPRDNCTFIMGGSSGSPETQMPAYIQWKVPEYDYFRCEVGAGMWGHSEGTRYRFLLTSVTPEGKETLLLQTTKYIGKGEAPYTMVAKLPEDHKYVRVYLYTENGNVSASSCVIADSFAYNVPEGYEPATGIYYGEGADTFEPGNPGASISPMEKPTKREPVYTIPEIERHATGLLRLTHSNVRSYAIYFADDSNPEGSCREKPLPDSLAGEETWYIGTNAYHRDNCAFIMAGRGGDNQLPAYIQWKIPDYDYFRCEVGAGMWEHSNGDKYRFVVTSITAEGVETKLLDTERYLSKGDEPLMMAVELPSDHKYVRVYLYTKGGGVSSTSCVIADAVAYNISAKYAPENCVMPVAGANPEDSDNIGVGITLAPQDTAAPEVTEKPKETLPRIEIPEYLKNAGGCGAVISTSALLLGGLLVLPISLKKKKH